MSQGGNRRTHGGNAELRGIGLQEMVLGQQASDPDVVGSGQEG